VTLPVVGTPGGTVRILLSREAGYVVYAPLSGDRRALGGALGVAGPAVLGRTLQGLVANTRRIRRSMDKMLVG
jgi:hypothetical protein